MTKINEDILDQNFGIILQLAKLKNDNPKEYKKLMNNIKTVMKDLYGVIAKAMIDTAKTIDKLENDEEKQSETPDTYY